MIYPLVVMTIGIVLVIGMIMWLRINAFIALITAAMVVSLLSPEVNPATGERTLSSSAISRVADAFGTACGSIAIVIALAAVIGACMMDSGAADRVVRGFMALLGEKRAPWALMGSGYVLAIPVFFDTVFYLLVPLARSFQRRTGGAYLKCILAITAGGAITHTLVPPTPGPLTMAANLGVDLGRMILVGALVALPASIVGLFIAGLLDRWLNIPMRQIAGHPEPEPLADDELPGLMVSLLPVLLPVALIAVHTLASTFADSEQLARADQRAAALGVTVEQQVRQRIDDVRAAGGDLSRGDALKQVKADALGDSAEPPGTWTRATAFTQIIGNPNLALLISAAIALAVYVRQRKPSKDDVAKLIESSLMSGGLIILITAAGSAFGAMLRVAQVGDAIRELFGGQSSGLAMLFLGFGISALLKVAQGSSTAAMIIASGMMPGLLTGVDLPFDIVYLATAIGSGAMVGSWMNDSGFWIFAKMGGLTEREALCTWTPLLAALGVVSMTVTVILATLLPLV
ncbi:MAG: gluconate permease [Planctomyces sp.]|nr:gluconate permease [Planctomyces sp.]